MIPHSSSVANPSGRKRRKAGFTPIPVSKFPDETVYRVCRVRRAIPGRWDGDNGVQAGELLLVRRSPHKDAPRSYWIEEEDGKLRGIITEDMFERDLEVFDA